MRDALFFGALALSLALFCTFSVAQCHGLFRARRAGAALAALVFPPVGSYFAWREGLRVRAAGALISGLLYVVFRSLS